MTSTVIGWKLLSQNKIPIKGTPWWIYGESYAARHTIVYIGGLGICFDIGMKTEESPTHIFISHAHSDHVYGLPSHLLEPARGPPVVIVPKPSKNYIEQMILSHHRATKNNPHASTNCRFVEVSIPSKIGLAPMYLQEEFTIKNALYAVELFKCTHTIATNGYGIIGKKSKLKKEYVGKSQEELEALKIEGHEICEIVSIPHFAYLGDTTHHVFYTEKNSKICNPNIEKYGTIFVECTFLHDTPDEIKHAKKKKHMHWINLKPYIVSHPDITFVLGHFSTRYKPSEIRTFFDSQHLPNVTLLLNDFTEMNYKYFVSVLKKDSSLMAKFMRDIGAKTESDPTKSMVDAFSDALVPMRADVEHDCCEEHGCDTDHEDEDEDEHEHDDSHGVEESKGTDDSCENTMSSQLTLDEHDVSVPPNTETTIVHKSSHTYLRHFGELMPTFASYFLFGGRYDDDYDREDILGGHECSPDGSYCRERL
jgi:ribonuclease Z